MEKFSGDALDRKLLCYFAVAAEEGSLRGAARRLNISQSLLNQHIRNFEESLGLTLFLRHNRGLSLTGSGAVVLESVLPLLETQDSMYARLAAFSRKPERDITLGLTTGFEQGVFWGVEARLRGLYGKRVHFVRESSNPLVQMVRQGKLDLALIALPFNTQGLISAPLPYAESRVLALPAAWLESPRPWPAGQAGLKLEDLRGRPLLRLSRDHNPCFFLFIKDIFDRRNFQTQFIEESPDHSVALSRIAAGEAMGLFPTSFTTLKRQGVVYRPVEEGDLLRAQLAIVTLPLNAGLLEEIRNTILPVIPPPHPLEP